MLGRGSDAISPTAHYTGYVWFRNGLSHEVLATRRGRLLYEAVRPWMALNARLGGSTLESYLLARHEGLDVALTRAIDEGGVTQVVEVAAGLSARGLRFTRRYGDRLTYVEVDLAEMAARKRRALERTGSLGANHRVEELDALRDDGPGSLQALAETLDRTAPVAIITEGLVGYFDRETALGMWRRFARVLDPFPQATYLSDLHLARDLSRPQVRVFRVVLSAFVRGWVPFPFREEDDARAALAEAGFAEVVLRRPPDDHEAPDRESKGSDDLVRILEARLHPTPSGGKPRSA